MMLTFQVPLRTSEGVCGRRGAVDGLRTQSLRVKLSAISSTLPVCALNPSSQSHMVGIKPIFVAPIIATLYQVYNPMLWRNIS